MNTKTARKKMLKVLDKFNQDVREQQTWDWLYGMSISGWMELAPLVSDEDWAAWAAVLDLGELIPEYEELRDVVLAEHVARATAKFKARAEAVQVLREHVKAYEASAEMQVKLSYYNRISPRITFSELLKEVTK